jgi:cystathionine beta-lyase
MTDDINPRETRKRGFRTTLSHVGRATKREHGFVNPPLLRGSTVLVPTVKERQALQARRGERVLTYGTGGSATHWALEDAIAAIEGGMRCYVVSTGLAAVTTPLLAWLKAGDHMLMPDHVYGPARNFASTMLRDFGVETTFYLPEIDEAGLAALMRPNTKVVYTESPGSHTFEVQNVPAIARAAHAGGAKVFMDNTWGIHHFQPFAHGVDVSIQAATKYLAGHSDVLIGSITVNNDADWQILHSAGRTLGQYASPDDCWLTLRGIRTMAVRLQAQMESALQVAHWLRQQPEVAQVLHPGLPGAPGHDLWRRDFTGACSLFGVEFKRRIGSSRRSICSGSARPGAGMRAWRCRPRGSSPGLPEGPRSAGRSCGSISGWRMWTTLSPTSSRGWRRWGIRPVPA